MGQRDHGREIGVSSSQIAGLIAQSPLQAGTAYSQSVGLIAWNPYSEYAAVLLSLILFAVGIGVVILGRRLTKDFKLPMPGKKLRVLIVLVWVLSILVVLRLFRNVATDTGQPVGNIGPVFPITLASAFCVFLFIAYVSRRDGIGAAIGNAFAGAAAGPMVFELPFVLIITPVVTTTIHSGLLLFVVFLVVILTTLALPLFSSRFAVTRYSLYLLGGMILVFAAWALLTGYAPPSDPVSFSLNAASKVLGFAAIAATFATGGKATRQVPLAVAPPAD
jgi:hypothetical protein